MTEAHKQKLREEAAAAAVVSGHATTAIAAAFVYSFPRERFFEMFEELWDEMERQISVVVEEAEAQARPELTSVPDADEEKKA